MSAEQYTDMGEIIVDGGLRRRLEELVGRRREARVVAALVMIVGVVALILWMRGAPARIAPPAAAGEPFAPTTATPQATAGVTVVHVGGAVKRAGIFELQPGARVADALELAVPRDNADLNALNLAEPVTDGAKIDVPRRGEAAAAASSGSESSPSPSGEPAAALVNVNTADEALLDTIPEVGPATAQAILEYRTQIGSFTSVEQLIEVSGIGPATLEAMRPFVTV
ncbi:MAG: ComEA family DNA-binding protein [Actinomycetota bacterium]